MAVGHLQHQLTRTTERLKTTLDTGPSSRFAASLEAWNAAAEEFSRVAPTLKAPDELLQEFVEMRQELTEENARLIKTIGALIAQVQHATTAMGQESQQHHAVADQVSFLSRQMGQSMERFINDAQEILRANDILIDRMLRQVGAFEPLPERGDDLGTNGSTPRQRTPGTDDWIDPFGGRP